MSKSPKYGHGLVYLNPRRLMPGRCAMCGTRPGYRRRDGKAVHLGRIVPWGETLAWCCMVHAGRLTPRLRRLWQGKRVA